MGPLEPAGRHHAVGRESFPAAVGNGLPTYGTRGGFTGAFIGAAGGLAGFAFGALTFAAFGAVAFGAPELLARLPGVELERPGVALLFGEFVPVPMAWPLAGVPPLATA
jgi:hypothetical protein